MIAIWILALPISLYLTNYSADRIGIPAYGSNIPFSWVWTPVFTASLILFFVALFHTVVWITS